MDYFGVPEDHTPPATPPPTSGFNKIRPSQRLRSTYIGLSITDPNLSYDDVERVATCFEHLPSHQKRLLLNELIDRCDNDILAFVYNLAGSRLKIDFLKELPIELSLHVISYIDDPRDMANASRVSKFWNALLKDEATWKSLCMKHRYRRLSSILNCPSSPTWQHYVQQRIQRESYRDYFWRKYNTDVAWRQGTGRIIQCPNSIGQAIVTSLQIDEQYIVVGCDNSVVDVFSSVTGEHLRSLRGHDGGVWALQFAIRKIDGARILVSGGCDRAVLVWNLDSGQLLHTLHGHTSTVRCLKVSTDAKLAVTGSRDTTIRIWDIEHGISKHLCIGHQASVRCLDVHDNQVATGSYDATARLWDMQTGRCLHVFTGHHCQVYSIAYDGTHVATGSLDWTVRVWSPITGQCLALLQGHTSLVGHVQLLSPIDSPPLLVSAGADGCLRVWDLQRYACRHRISAHDNSISCFQVDCKRILSGGNDGVVKLWDLETGSLIRTFSDLTSTVIWKLQFTDTKAAIVYQLPSQSNHASPDTVIELHHFDLLSA